MWESWCISLRFSTLKGSRKSMNSLAWPPIQSSVRSSWFQFRPGSRRVPPTCAESRHCQVSLAKARHYGGSPGFKSWLCFFPCNQGELGSTLGDSRELLGLLLKLISAYLQMSSLMGYHSICLISTHQPWSGFPLSNNICVYPGKENSF